MKIKKLTRQMIKTQNKSKKKNLSNKPYVEEQNVHIHSHNENAAFEYLSATNEEKWICNVCNEIYTVPHTNHTTLIEGKRDYSNISLEVCYTAPQICSICHKEVIPAEVHAHNFDKDDYCKECMRFKDEL